MEVCQCPGWKGGGGRGVGVRMFMCVCVSSDQPGSVCSFSVRKMKINLIYLFRKIDSTGLQAYETQQ